MEKIETKENRNIQKVSTTVPLTRPRNAMCFTGCDIADEFDSLLGFGRAVRCPEVWHLKWIGRWALGCTT